MIVFVVNAKLIGISFFVADKLVSIYVLLALAEKIYTLISAVMSLNTWFIILSYEDAD